MKRLSVIIALGVIALMADGAGAAPYSQHRAGIHADVGKMPRAPGNAYGYAPRPAPQNKSLADRFSHPYESESLGRQSFENPDRVFRSGQYP